MSTPAGPAPRPDSFAERTTAELAAMPPVALFPIGSTEAHGPHLPLSTDVILAEETARRAHERLARRGVASLVLPALPYATTEFLLPFAGTISVDGGAVARLIEDVAASLFRHGVRVVALVNGHLEPAHGRVLAQTAGRVSAAGAGTLIFPDQRRPPVVESLGREFGQGGGHAGGYETSLVMAAAPHLVRESVRRALAPNKLDLAAKMRKGAADARAAGGPEAYFGDPAGASAAEGERLYEVLATMVEEAVVAALTEPRA